MENSPGDADHVEPADRCMRLTRGRGFVRPRGGTFQISSLNVCVENSNVTVCGAAGGQVAEALHYDEVRCSKCS